MEKISVFLSWSKDKSKEYAEITEKFLCNICDNKLSFFFSPDMEKGSHSNLEITEKLINCDKCLIFLTNENYKNPWAVFEAGVALGSKPLKNNTVIPVLFDTIPSWSSWIDNPLYPYTIINMTSSVSGKNDFKSFLNSFGIKICHSKFESEWEEYIKNILNVRKKYQLFPSECEEIMNLFYSNEKFSIENPLIKDNKVIFYRGFLTFEYFSILINQIRAHNSKILWLYGRKNEKLVYTDFEYFFKDFNKTINDVDFRCLFAYPFSEASIKPCTKEKNYEFNYELLIKLKDLINYSKKYQIDCGKYFKMYKYPRKILYNRIDNAVLTSEIYHDVDGYLTRTTDTQFEIISALSDEGKRKSTIFENVWKDAIPVTEDIIEKLWNNNFRIDKQTR